MLARLHIYSYQSCRLDYICSLCIYVPHVCICRTGLLPKITLSTCMLKTHPKDPMCGDTCRTKFASESPKTEIGSFLKFAGEPRLRSCPAHRRALWEEVPVRSCFEFRICHPPYVASWDWFLSRLVKQFVLWQIQVIFPGKVFLPLK